MTGRPLREDKAPLAADSNDVDFCGRIVFGGTGGETEGFSKSGVCVPSDLVDAKCVRAPKDVGETFGRGRTGGREDDSLSSERGLDSEVCLRKARQ